MIDLIRNEFASPDASAEFESALSGAPNNYQSAFRFLHARKGQDAANHIVRSAVWTALDAKNWPSELPPDLTDREADAAACTTLERYSSAWHLPTAVNAFGQLLVDCSDTFGRTVLTTNFDPLIAVSISRHGGRHFRTVLHSDGALGQTAAEGTHIVHLHGYWYGADTLHTPQQLTLPRPQLAQSLTHILRDSTLVVVGYGGWDDVMTQALIQIVRDSSSNSEIMWAFHDNEHDRIANSNKQLLTRILHQRS
ncbi:MAG: SIR2 family protein [Gemmatimonadetes bacterium]|nr:SIR2 family protein [Gemmatimonadota bacterium]